MRAIALQKPGRFQAVDIPEPNPGPGEALVAVERIGVCGTDWHAFAGRQPFFDYPRILGHELGVRVLGYGPETEASIPVGAHCAVEPYLNDPEMPASRAGRTNCCERLRCLGVHTDGGMTRRMVIPARKLHASDTLSLDALALVETLCIGAHAIERARPRRDERVLIIGAGPIGLSAYLFAQLECEDVTLLDVSQERLRFSEDTLGITRTLFSEEDVLERVKAAYLGGGPDIIVDATGNRESMERTFAMVANGGTIVFLGLFQGDVSFHDPDFHRKEITLMASRNAPAETFKKVIDHLERGRIDSRPWITHRVSLSEVPRRLPELAGRKDVLKVMIEVD